MVSILATDFSRVQGFFFASTARRLIRATRLGGRRCEGLPLSPHLLVAKGVCTVIDVPVIARERVSLLVRSAQATDELAEGMRRLGTERQVKAVGQPWPRFSPGAAPSPAQPWRRASPV
jgi:hypothetical protein